MKLIFKSILILFPCHILFACDCNSLAKLNSQFIQAADNIFIGKVLDIENVNNKNKKITFQVLKAFKGSSDSSKVSIWTGIGGADCGLIIEKGQEWYIFSNKYQERSQVSTCGRSAQLSEINIENSDKKYQRSAKKKYKREKRRAQREIRVIKRYLNSSAA